MTQKSNNLQLSISVLMQFFGKLKECRTNLVSIPLGACIMLREPISHKDTLLCNSLEQHKDQIDKVIYIYTYILPVLASPATCPPWDDWHLTMNEHCLSETGQTSYQYLVVGFCSFHLSSLKETKKCLIKNNQSLHINNAAGY